jgi:hypothetical protein
MSTGKSSNVLSVSYIEEKRTRSLLFGHSEEARSPRLALKKEMLEFSRSSAELPQ